VCAQGARFSGERGGEAVAVILALDPGKATGAVWYETDTAKVLHAVGSMDADAAVRCWTNAGPTPAASHLVMERIEPYVSRTRTGAPYVKQDVCEAELIAGRILQAWIDDQCLPTVSESVTYVKRAAVKQHLLGSVAGTDAQVRRMLLARHGFPATAKRSELGHLKAVTSHAWAALGCAVLYADQNNGRARYA
jgi:hypothetical protein